MSRTAWWCEWCGDTCRAHDQFCGRECALEWMRDVGGYQWLIDLMELQTRRSEQLAKQAPRPAGDRPGWMPQRLGLVTRTQ